MSEIKDSSIHKDGIYDIDKSCRVDCSAIAAEDRLMFVLMAIFLFVQ